jgi:hypothetical protein
MSEAEHAFRLAESIQIDILDSSLSGERVVASIRGRHHQIGGVARHVLLCLRKHPMDADRIRSELREDGIDCPREIVDEILREFAKRDIIETGDQGRSASHQNWWNNFLSHPYLAIKLPLLSGDLLWPITSAMAPIFHPAAMATLVPATLLFQVWWFAQFRHILSSPLKLSGSQLAWLIVANYGGLFLHELGHAAGCARERIRHGNIGFCIYLVIPAFYADVSAAWRMSRWKRLIVDAGGIYMTLLAATAAVVAFRATGEMVFGYAAAFYDITVLISLVPVVRTDGYWIFSDVLGIPNLMATNRDVTGWLFRKALGKAGLVPTTLRCAPRSIRIAYVVYYPLFLISATYLFFMCMFWYLPRLTRVLPTLLATLNVQLLTGQSSWDTVRLVMQCLLSIAPLVGVAIYLARAINWTVLRARRWWARGISS